MKEQINEEMLDRVAGGTVILSRDYNTVGFTTTGQNFPLKNCDYYQALQLIDQMYVNNKQATDADFDKIVRKEFAIRGWI